MKVTIAIFKTNPTGVEKIELDDVASYEVTDLYVKFMFNKTSPEMFSLTNKDGSDWLYMSIVAEKVGMKIDFNK